MDLNSGEDADVPATEIVVPGGWRPSLKEPVPVMQCTAPRTNGERCKRWSLRGTNVCQKHGGQLASVQAHAAAVVEAARLRLYDLGDKSVDTIEALMEPGTADGIRLKAATEVLDRVGIRGGTDSTLSVEVTNNTPPAELLTQRLKRIADRSAVNPVHSPDDIVDAEVVADDQDTLFDL